MPIYEFKCMKCDIEFEYLVFNSNEAVTCPECNKDKVKRLMSTCSHRSGGGGGSGDYAPASAASSGCSGCSGGSCATCH